MKEFDSKTEAKNILIYGDDYLRTITFTGLFRDDGDYPKRFWRVETYPRNKKIYRTVKHVFELMYSQDPALSYDVDTLEEAVSSMILNLQSGIKYERVNPSDIKPHLKNAPAWRDEKIVLVEYYNDHKDRYTYSTSYFIKSNEEYILDYDDHYSSNLQSMLISIPGKWTSLQEVPYAWDMRVLGKKLDNRDIEEYPMFEYKGNMFETKYYFSNQRCVCGVSDTYYNEYDQDNTIKVDIDHVQLFKKDTIYVYQGFIVCNITYRKQTVEEREKIEHCSKRDEIVEKLKKEFPKAKELSTWSEGIPL